MKTTTQAAADTRLYRLMTAFAQADREKIRALITGRRPGN